MGLLEVLVIECPGDRFKGEILLGLASAIDSVALRIIDVTFVHKDTRGRLTSYELAELEEHELVPYDVVDETRGLLSVEDIAQVGEGVSPNSSAMLLVIEHTWTSQLEQAILAANCRIVLHERIPHDVAIAALGDGRRRGDRTGGSFSGGSRMVDGN